MSSELTRVEEITVINIRTAAGFPVVPSDLSPELRSPTERLRAGEPLTDEQIVEMVDREVELNSIP